ncbi:MAG: Holliday junction branch migration protein RuvA [Candidatus Taylorbacteria bacterium]|nr:Holliday junction branch migration protein RuvA [Candidatus Taylorbacteria bacterium]
MISYLEGIVFHKDLKSAVVKAGGVGYKVFATPEVLEKLRLGQTAALWTYEAVREDSHDLYGFLTKENLNLFELLLTVSGIGPKTALAILNLASPNTIRKAASSGDTSYLIKVSGIGRKTAERIVVELKEKIGPAEAGGGTEGQVEVAEALKSLGYSAGEVREAIKKIPETLTGTSERLKHVLKLLGR